MVKSTQSTVVILIFFILIAPNIFNANPVYEISTARKLYFFFWNSVKIIKFHALKWFLASNNANIAIAPHQCALCFKYNTSKNKCVRVCRKKSSFTHWIEKAALKFEKSDGSITSRNPNKSEKSILMHWNYIQTSQAHCSV